MTTVLEMDRVSFSYGRGAPAALTEVSLTIGRGERVALLGHNGAGKSTLMRLVTGLARAGSGTIRLNGADTRGQAPEQLALSIGSLFQHADQQLFARTVQDDVAFGPRVQGVAPDVVDQRVARALTELGLEALANEHPYDLPPPHRKLAALAGALALDPMLLLLDEPTAGLDRALRDRVTAALAARAQAGVAVLVITHDLGFAVETVERALVLERGWLACDLGLAALLADAERVAALGLVRPPLAEAAARLRLPGSPLVEAEFARTLAQRCRG